MALWWTCWRFGRMGVFSSVENLLQMLFYTLESSFETFRAIASTCISFVQKWRVNGLTLVVVWLFYPLSNWACARSDWCDKSYCKECSLNSRALTCRIWSFSWSTNHRLRYRLAESIELSLLSWDQLTYPCDDLKVQGLCLLELPCLRSFGVTQDTITALLLSRSSVCKMRLTEAEL